MKKRRILAVTGIRSDYDIMSSVYKAIGRRRELSLELLVTGAHLAEAYGRTVSGIKADGFPIAEEVESLISGDSDSSRVKGLAVGLQGMVQAAARLRPDFLLVLGDREEAIATALTGNYLNIPVAHVAGGDRVIGNVDDQIRHAVTKLAHLHFTTCSDSRARVLRMGEQSFRVFNTGNPGLDRLRSEPRLSARELSRRLGFELKEDEPVILLIQHSLSSEIAAAYFQMKETLEAVKALGIKTVLCYPNSDPGSAQIIRAISEYRSLKTLHAAKNIPRTAFVNLMRRAGCMLGNSSAGLLEAPALKLPAVNIGNRQKARLHAGNVQFVPHRAAAIARAVRKALNDTAYRARVSRCRNPYGDGRSGERIAKILAEIPLGKKLLIKEMAY